MLNYATTEWIQTLRTTENFRGRHYLMQVVRDDEGYMSDAYCCLGIACDISRLGAFVWRQGGYEYSYMVSTPGHPVHGAHSRDRLEGPSGCLPDPVRERLGLRTTTGDFWVTDGWLEWFRLTYPETALLMDEYIELHGSAFTSLAAVNDWTEDGGREPRFSFAAIADIVEGEPPGLFAYAE